MKKLSIEEIKNIWEQRAKLSEEMLSKGLWPDRPVWNRYLHEKLYMHYLKPYINSLRPSDVVLEVGCNGGALAFKLAKFCNTVYGIDFATSTIKFAKEFAKKYNITNVKFNVMDVRKLAFENNTFNWVFSRVCITFITNKDDFIQAIREIIRVTKKNGYIIFLERISDKNETDATAITLPRNQWFEIIEKNGAKIKYWTGVDVPSLRFILNCFFALLCKYTRKKWNINGDIINADRKKIEYFSTHNKINRSIEDTTMWLLTTLIMPFEYVIPKIYKNQSLYSLVYIVKNE